MTLTLRAAWLILLSAAGVRFLGFHRTKSLVESRAHGRPRAAADCVRAVRRARAYGLYRGNCLSQSLALQWLLRRAGHNGIIQIGVKPGDGRMLAHAWVELGEEIIDPAAISSEYAPLLL